MAKSKFCPECGTEIPAGTNICENCGIVLQTKSTPTKAKKSARPKKSGSNDFWTTLEPIIADWVGKYAWLILILIPIIMLIFSLLATIPLIIASIIPGTGNLIWSIISTIFEIPLAWFWVKPKFSERCANREWDLLLDDVIVVGGYKIPWMLVMGLPLEVFGYGWLGLVVLGPAIAIIFFGPRQPYNWK